MFKVFQSSQMDQLARQLILRLELQRRNQLSLAADTILIQHAGMTRWLKMQIAEKTGIAANLNCTFPAAFLWKVHQIVLADQQLPDESPYSAEQLTWSIMNLLPGLVQQQPGIFQQLSHYLEHSTDHARPGDEQLKRLQLSSRLARLFEQYLLYRGDWIRQWEVGESVDIIPENQHWQGYLWQVLKKHRSDQEPLPGPHRVEIHHQFLEQVGRLTSWPKELPECISIFGISSLPPELLEALALIGKRDDVSVDLYLLNPCIHYWGDILPEKTIARKNLKQLLKDNHRTEPDDYLLFGNPLLASMGQEGKEFIDQVWEIDHADIQEPEEPCFSGEGSKDSLNMLGYLQHEIYNMTLRGEMEPLSAEISATDQGKLVVDRSDQSISVANCYGAMREIEVLYDQILEMLSEDASLTPRDVLVMAPDISTYAPFIESVFNNPAHGSSRLPYNISDRSLSDESAIYKSFLTLLALPDSRFLASEIVDMLMVPAIGQRFGFDSAEKTGILIRWVADSGIRWGVDASFKQQEWQVADNNHHTWAFGLDRLMLGYSMETEHGIYNNILPYSYLQGSDGELLGHLISFINALTALRTTLASPRTLEDWQQKLNDIIKGFYNETAETALEFRQIQLASEHLTHIARENNLDEPIYYQTLHHWMKQQLEQPGDGHGFLSRGVTFCNLVAMRNIPSRVICLVGMNDVDFPRNQIQPGFDLLANPSLHRRGDRSHRQDDRYMFLEALLAANDRLYISYTGKNDQDDKEREASVLLAEVLDYCERTFLIEGAKEADSIRDHLVTAYPLQPFSRRYFADNEDGHDDKMLFTYSQQWWNEASSQPSSEQSLYSCWKSAGSAIITAPESAPTADPIELEELISFFRNPAQYFFTRQLNISFPLLDEEISDEEPFSLDTLAGYQLMDEMLQEEITDEILDDWMQKHQAAGTVLPGNAGKNQLAIQRQRLTPLLKRLAQVSESFEPARTIEISSRLGESLVQGELKGLHGNKLVQYRPADIRAKDQLAGWIRLLALQAYRVEPFQLVLLGRKGDGYRYSVETNEAKKHLQTLVSLYLKGQEQPLFFIPDTSRAWQETIQSGGDKVSAAEKAALCWETTRFRRGEDSDPYFSRIFAIPEDLDEDSSGIAARIYQPLIEAEDRIQPKGKL
jgi:exodeoxyribonuclease V gamma subunit